MGENEPEKSIADYEPSDEYIGRPKECLQTLERECQSVDIHYRSFLNGVWVVHCRFDEMSIDTKGEILSRLSTKLLIRC